MRGRCSLPLSRVGMWRLRRLNETDWCLPVRLGLTISLLLHGSFMAWAILAMLLTEPLKPPEAEPIMVALVTPSDLLALKKGSETSTELEAKKNEDAKPDDQSKVQADSKPILAPEPAPEPEPTPKETKAEPPPEDKADPIADKLAELPPPGPTPEELAKKAAEEKAAQEKAKAEELAEEARKKAAEEAKKKAAEEAKKKAEAEKKRKEAEAKKKAEEKRKAEKRKKELAERKKKEAAKKKQQQADRLAALLDKDPTRKGATNYATDPMNPTDYSGPTAGAQMGNAPVLSVREQDLLRAQISAQLRSCWKLPGGGGGIETTVVTLKWQLRPDGSLDGEPMIEGARSGMVFQIAAEAAIRAVRTCAPFNLPPDMYWAWRSLTWDFDPREML